ncbi:hypothetical protein EGW08_008204 [Elysia chlorotica]|uniref:Uncharacterized protein n=1 Tax=Elysia chlorotica TaxID=188477 RepID=A0A433TRC0_ELYCH|nr:hypothetical protein EGW08_008204 [Elysia chlorotica]
MFIIEDANLDGAGSGKPEALLFLTPCLRQVLDLPVTHGFTQTDSSLLLSDWLQMSEVSGQVSGFEFQAVASCTHAKEEALILINAMRPVLELPATHALKINVAGHVGIEGNEMADELAKIEIEVEPSRTESTCLMQTRCSWILCLAVEDKADGSTRTLSGRKINSSRPVQDKNGNLIPGEEEQRTRWAEHFKEALNRSSPPDIPPPTELLDINTNLPSRSQIAKAIKSLKSGKAAGPDGIPLEVS